MTFDRTHPGFVDFIRESNRIEGILRDPTEDRSSPMSDCRNLFNSIRRRSAISKPR